MILVNKPLGLTPFQTIEKLRIIKPEYQSSKLAYAGRLDPLATGLLLVLVDDECENRDVYQNLDKTYEFEVLFGVKTDSLDCLGIVENYLPKTSVDDFNIKQITYSLCGKIEQEYPVFSSKTVNGKPLYWWKRNNKLHEIVIPKKEVEIYKIEHEGSEDLLCLDVLEQVLARVDLVGGDFRQEEIKQSWSRALKNTNNCVFKKMKFFAHVSSGTYIRAIAQILGEQIKIPAIAWNIHRTSVGKYSLQDAIELESSRI